MYLYNSNRFARSHQPFSQPAKQEPAIIVIGKIKKEKMQKNSEQTLGIVPNGLWCRGVKGGLEARGYPKEATRSEREKKRGCL